MDPRDEAAPTSPPPPLPVAAAVPPPITAPVPAAEAQPAPAAASVAAAASGAAAAAAKPPLPAKKEDMERSPLGTFGKVNTAGWSSTEPGGRKAGWRAVVTCLLASCPCLLGGAVPWHDFHCTAAGDLPVAVDAACGGAVAGQWYGWGHTVAASR